MDIKSESHSNLLFLLTTEKVKNNQALKSQIEAEIKVREEQNAQRNEEERIKSKKRAPYKWGVFLLIILSFSYWTYSIFNCEDCERTYVQQIRITLPDISEEEANQLFKDFYQDSYHNDARNKFPHLAGVIKEKMSLNVKHNTDALTRKTHVEVIIGFALEEDEKDHPDKEKVTKFYADKILDQFGVDKDNI